MIKIKKIFFILLYLLVSLIFIFGSLELFLRIDKKFGYIHQSFRVANLHPSHIKNLQSQYYRTSRLLGYEYVPNTKFFGNFINSYGLIGKEYKLKKEKGIFRILLLGDSIAAQHWSCLYLEDLLNNDINLKSKYKKFEIWNAGTPSYDVRRYALFLKYRGLRFNPDMVLIFLFMNDFNLDTNVYYKTKEGAVAYYCPLSELSKIYSINPFLLKHSYLYRFIVLRINQYLLNKKKSINGNPQVDDSRYYLNIIRKICQDNKIKLFIVVFPYLKPLEEYKDWQKSEYEDILRLLKEIGLTYTNLYDFLPKENLINIRENKEDDIHPSQQGHKIIAEIIYRNLLSCNIIN